ncbi:prepilin-type N-terminal cleavage/methylation domain-containing protein [Marinimicrobium sp. ABcell2]|uniref:prepilin-type N-terminal cleavage/methylation domain-containing protein n=1 Tax=Marinimicrobium sp. ABcell2 TaxID=3069751 RepID=UPI0027B7FE68|nr:prepilin-type N-terminal cleavage/methylation domain-containing protein [Marinimicrobium sp. ABcell2]MDQ2075230.1 prepilin-type N-terminal cleavage/methylation domain-containing protein [Marinimicrobium sp. ABcell2]
MATINNRGFSLIELMAVILVIAVISVVAYPRFTDTNVASVQTGRDQALSVITYAQQIAMARASATNPIEVIVSANSIDVRESGASLRPYADAYPESLPTGVSATPATFQFDKLGRTTPSSITFSRGGVTATIQVEASGYAHY